MALLLLGGALWADQPPALAISAGQESPRFNTVLGPEITLAEAQSRLEEEPAEASAERNGVLTVQLPPLPAAPPPPAQAAGPGEAAADAQADPPPRAPAPGLTPAAPVAPGPTPPVSAPGSPTAEAPAKPLPRLAQPNPAEAIPLELELLSNQQDYDAQLERFVSTGHVSAKIAGGRLQADRIEFDPATRTLYAVGAVRFQRGQQFFQASRLRYSLLEGMGELDDVYGVLDLDGSAQDLDLTQPPSTPLPPPEPFSCPPSLPPIPEWHPYPWAVTGWADR
jgi:hypothetical protein